jgi:hypothetical protein
VRPPRRRRRTTGRSRSWGCRTPSSVGTQSPSRPGATGVTEQRALNAHGTPPSPRRIGLQDSARPARPGEVADADAPGRRRCIDPAMRSGPSPSSSSTCGPGPGVGDDRVHRVRLNAGVFSHRCRSSAREKTRPPGGGADRGRPISSGAHTRRDGGHRPPAV